MWYVWTPFLTMPGWCSSSEYWYLWSSVENWDRLSWSIQIVDWWLIALVTQRTAWPEHVRSKGELLSKHVTMTINSDNLQKIKMPRFTRLILEAEAGPLWGYFSHLWSLSLNFFCLKALGKKWKMTPLLCACAVVITLETQKCRKRAPRYVEFNFFNNCDRQKRFSQNERRRADLQTLPQIF